MRWVALANSLKQEASMKRGGGGVQAADVPRPGARGAAVLCQPGLQLPCAQGPCQLPTGGHDPQRHASAFPLSALCHKYGMRSLKSRVLAPGSEAWSQGSH